MCLLICLFSLSMCLFFVSFFFPISKAKSLGQRLSSRLKTFALKMLEYQECPSSGPCLYLCLWAVNVAATYQVDVREGLLLIGWLTSQHIACLIRRGDVFCWLLNVPAHCLSNSKRGFFCWLLNVPADCLSNSKRGCFLLVA